MKRWAVNLLSDRNLATLRKDTNTRYKEKILQNKISDIPLLTQSEIDNLKEQRDYYHKNKESIHYRTPGTTLPTAQKLQQLPPEEQFEYARDIIEQFSYQLAVIDTNADKINEELKGVHKTVFQSEDWKKLVDGGGLGITQALLNEYKQFKYLNSENMKLLMKNLGYMRNLLTKTTFVKEAREAHHKARQAAEGLRDNAYNIYVRQFGYMDKKEWEKQYFRTLKQITQAFELDSDQVIDELNSGQYDFNQDAFVVAEELATAMHAQRSGPKVDRRFKEYRDNKVDERESIDALSESMSNVLMFLSENGVDVQQFIEQGMDGARAALDAARKLGYKTAGENNENPWDMKNKDLASYLGIVDYKNIPTNNKMMRRLQDAMEAETEEGKYKNFEELMNRLDMFRSNGYEVSVDVINMFLNTFEQTDNLSTAFDFIAKPDTSRERLDRDVVDDYKEHKVEVDMSDIDLNFGDSVKHIDPVINSVEDDEDDGSLGDI